MENPQDSLLKKKRADLSKYLYIQSAAHEDWDLPFLSQTYMVNLQYICPEWNLWALGGTGMITLGGTGMIAPGPV